MAPSFTRRCSWGHGYGNRRTPRVGIGLQNRLVVDCGDHRTIWYDGFMQLTLTLDREEDGRWIVEVPELPGVLVYGATESEAMAKAEVLALRVLADRIEHGEAKPVPISIVIPAAA